MPPLSTLAQKDEAAYLLLRGARGGGQNTYVCNTCVCDAQALAATRCYSGTMKRFWTSCRAQAMSLQPSAAMLIRSACHGAGFDTMNLFGT